MFRILSPIRSFCSSEAPQRHREVLSFQISITQDLRSRAAIMGKGFLLIFLGLLSSTVLLLASSCPARNRHLVLQSGLLLRALHHRKVGRSRVSVVRPLRLRKVSRMAQALVSHQSLNSPRGFAHSSILAVKRCLSPRELRQLIGRPPSASRPRRNPTSALLRSCR